MLEIIKMGHDTLNEMKLSPQEELQLNKICEVEDKFVKDFSKDKWKEYFNLDMERSKLCGMQIDKAIIVAYELCKKIFQK